MESFSNSVSLIDPGAYDPNNLEADGPKELVTADFDDDGRPDLAASKTFGKVAVVFGEGGKEFSAAHFLTPPEGSGELRGIAAADFNLDGWPDLAVAAPYAGRVVLFFSQGDRSFGAPVVIEAWRGVRNLLALDLDGDGDKDLVAAGAHSVGLKSGTVMARASVNDGAGSFAVGQAIDLTGGFWIDDFPRPVVAMAALPAVDGVGQHAVVTHVHSDKLWVLTMEEDGALVIADTTASLRPTRSLAVGPLTSQGGAPDLVQAARDENEILVRLSDGAGGFASEVAQRLYVPGAPRAVAIADLDADGWKDLLVVLRDFDRVLTFHNDEGTLVLAGEAPVGSSPRDLAPADFNGDGRIDLAVSNRRSDDLTVLLTQAGGPSFERLDSVYDVDGGVSDLLVADMNDDGRDDVIQGHVLTAEISVRLARADGLLGAPVYTKLESPPVSFQSGDFNDDGALDLIAVHSDTAQPGLSVLKGDGEGGFAPPSFYPSADGSGLFSIILADFDGDGVKDAAVGNYDCRLSMFQGTADGEFILKRTGLFTYEARAMVAADFDQDGDLDLAGASANGNMTVVENDGTLLTVPAADVVHELIFRRTKFEAPAGKGRIKSMVIVDRNGDEDEDLAINSEDGVSVFIGREGLEFEALPAVLPGTRGASDLVMGDFDGDGIEDIASACRLLSCVAILKGQPGGGSYELAAIAPVPSSDHLATGDLDGDGLADLVGSGEALWVALSGRAPDSAVGSFDPARPPRDALVINEVLASNKSIILGQEGGTPDAIELYNGRVGEMSLDGWRLIYKRKTLADGIEYPPATHVLPPSATIGGRGRLVLYADEEPGYPHLPFKLAREGATITLMDPQGAVVDVVNYDEQEEDTSLGRYTDGAEVLMTKNVPDLGAPNYWSGTIEPDFESVSVDSESIAALGTPMSPVLRVKADDRIGIFTLTAVWKTLDGEFSGRVGLYDDGFHDDGGALDGWFAGSLPELPSGAKVEFFLQATNLIDNEETSPGDPVFSLPGLPVTNYAFAIPEPEGLPAGLEISEVQAARAGFDEHGEWADYIELRNVGENAVVLDGLAIRDSLFDAEKSHFLKGILVPGQYRLLFADGNPSAGANHVPFKVDKNGDAVWLVKLDERDVVMAIERVRPPDDARTKASWSRLGPGGEFVHLPATQGKANVPTGEIYVGYVPPARAGQSASLRVGFAAPLGSTSVVESLGEGPGWSWFPERAFPGNGFEVFTDFPVDRATKLFRVRK